MPYFPQLSRLIVRPARSRFNAARYLILAGVGFEPTLAVRIDATHRSLTSITAASYAVGLSATVNDPFDVPIRQSRVRQSRFNAAQ
jgi:hypothetical protein